MAKARILIIDDDRDIVDLLTLTFKEVGYETLKAFDGREGMTCARRKQPDVIIMDIMLPEVDGFEMCRELKAAKATTHIPILILSTRSQETDKVVGLELGAEDYVTKPFSPRELIARVRVILRRNRIQPYTHKIQHGKLLINRNKHKVTVDDEKVVLTTTEFKLLEVMAQRPGHVLTRDQILDAISNEDAAVLDRTVDAHVKSLRRKLGPCKDYIETVRGIGYRLMEV